MDARLANRYDELVKSHMSNNSTVSAGVKSTLKTNTAFNQTQAAWRFFNNHNCTLKDLSEPLLQAAHEQLPDECEEYALAVHDWSNLGYNKHTSKKDTYNVFKGCVGYHLQTSLILSDKHGGPLAPAAINLKTKNDLLSSYGTPSRELSNLDELALRINWLEEQGFKKELVHIVDREGDSVKFFRDIKDKNWLVRVKGGNYVTHNSVDKIISKASEGLEFTYSREVLYKGKKALQKTAETTVEVTRDAVPSKKKNKNAKKIKGEPVKCKLIVSKIYDQTGKELAVWYLLSNMMHISSEKLALWYYWRWSIECFFKLLKKAGLNLEQWQQETAPAIAKRILVASMACVFIWKLAHDTRPEATPVKKLLVRLSGRQMKWGVEFTYNALFAGLWTLLAMKDLLDQYDTIDQLKDLIHNSIKEIGVV